MSDYQSPESANEVLRRYGFGERYFGQSELEEPICDFRGVTLAGADFSGSFIVADFREANLHSANFSHCNLKTCDFRGADLTSAVFRDSVLEGTEFDGSVMTGADFEGSNIFSHRMDFGEMPDW